MLVSSHYVPRWLEVLLTEKFFNACILHEEARKNEKNIYCLDCCISICPHCLSPHNSHRLLQIRRYVYHDVIRLDDARKLIDCVDVQSYTTNNAKVVFLNQRPQTRQFRGSGNLCSTCDRSLQDSYLFCSLYCKVDYLLRTQKGDLSRFLFECKFLPLPEPVSDDGLMTPDSVLESASSIKTSSGSSDGGVGCKTLASTATTEIVRKKRSSLSACRPIFSQATENSASLVNRRKKTPQRAPLH
ncbi:PLATZ domain-containing protein [Cephalotus follicularis]|uniref:PLATZ domain-containing protein n=1 Tax=Cephalotus follicularis TaxID=3775 RepID=A0A1Q3BUY2_CEPFO|nr:PLATZ domain-containing protein [Cephalotus follicularis]